MALPSRSQYDYSHRENANGYHDDCTFETYSAGESFTDVGLRGRPQRAQRNGRGGEDVAVQMFRTVPWRRIEADDPGCPNVPPCPAF